MRTDTEPPEPSSGDAFGPVPRPVLFAAAVWLMVALGGTVALTQYSSEPGEASDPPLQWPADSHLSLAADKPTLLMVLHPRCSCSRASIGELARLQHRLQGLFSGHILFVRPEGTDQSWAETDLRSSAELIPDMRSVEDLNGVEAERFGANTSGAIVLYGEDGRLLFHGGLTASRGHYGDSLGREQLIALLSGREATISEGDVYGCALAEDQGSNRR